MNPAAYPVCALMVAALVLGGHELSRTRHHRRMEGIEASLENLSQRHEELERNRLDLGAQIASQVGLDKSVAERQGSVFPLAEDGTPLPDEDRRGGWPPESGYAYLSKSLLQDGVTLLGGYFPGNRLSQPAVVLLGITPGERAQVDEALGSLATDFRAMEQRAMVPVEVPAVFAELHDARAYHIPALTNEVRSLRMRVFSAFRNSLGEWRTGLLLRPLEEYFDEALSGLGATSRTIVFGRDADGRTPVFATWDDTLETGGSRRLDTLNLPGPEDPIRYYAKVLGIEIPEKQ